MLLATVIFILFFEIIIIVRKYVFINLNKISKPNKILDFGGMVEKAKKTYFRKSIVIS